MSPRRPTPLPAALSRARQCFEQWRSQHRPRTKLPAELWSSAVLLAREHGLSKTAHALRLDYYSLKKRFDAADEPEEKVSAATADFIELLPAELSSPRVECTVEVEDGSGAKMRIHVTGPEVPDLSSLSRGFWRDGR